MTDRKRVPASLLMRVHVVILVESIFAAIARENAVFVNVVHMVVVVPPLRKVAIALLAIEFPFAFLQFLAALNSREKV